LITDNVIDDLSGFVLADKAQNMGRLYEILDQLQALAPDLRSPVIPAILDLIERYPEADLGSPGPLVHELEAIPAYEPFLRQSVLRQPADLTIWMVNRILNSEIPSDVREDWLQVLRMVLTHPLASKAARQTAHDFLEHQGEQ